MLLLLLETDHGDLVKKVKYLLNLLSISLWENRVVFVCLLAGVYKALGGGAYYLKPNEYHMPRSRIVST